MVENFVHLGKRRSMVVFPNAKINLGLNIVERRHDGYHNIETVMYPVKWCDVLEIVPAKGKETTLTVTGRTVDCPAEKNLVMKAYRMISAEVGMLPPVDIYLRKIIPDGAGLGGGSADASFTLMCLNDMFKLGLSDERLAGMASCIGADCPFFIYNRPMLATGIGTEFAPIEMNLTGYRIVIVKPRVSVPTAMAYSGVVPQRPSCDLRDALKRPLTEWNGVVKNDFEESVFALYPEIGAVKERLQQMGAEYVSMSGSGSAVYGIFKGDNLSEDMGQSFPECDIFMGEL